MRKGFTLVELLAIMALLGVLLLVAVPNIANDNKQSKEREYNEYKKTIENAAEVYVETSDDTYADLKNNNGVTATIQLSELKGAGVLKENLKNPKTNQLADGSVSAVNQNGMIKYTYNE